MGHYYSVDTPTGGRARKREALRAVESICSLKMRLPFRRQRVETIGPDIKREEAHSAMPRLDSDPAPQMRLQESRREDAITVVPQGYDERAADKASNRPRDSQLAEFHFATCVELDAPMARGRLSLCFGGMANINRLPAGVNWELLFRDQACRYLRWCLRFKTYALAVFVASTVGVFYCAYARAIRAANSSAAAARSDDRQSASALRSPGGRSATWRSRERKSVASQANSHV